MKPMSFLLCLLLAADGGQGQVGAAAPLAASTQMIVVTTSDWNAVDGRLERYERTTPHEPWRPVGKPIPIVIGKNGLGWGIGVIATDAPEVRAASDPVKKEGDGKAPAGVFALGTAFGFAPQALPGSKMPYLNLTSSTECVDDVGSKHYNRVVDRSPDAPDWNSSEHMRSIDLYRWGIIVGQNGGVTPAPGGGSCVFLHIWRSAREGTAGCTAMPQIELETLLTWLDPMHNPLLVQLPEPEYGRLMHRWKLPALAMDRPR
jgi:D-alanyl-D-alanine dipeptidase